MNSAKHEYLDVEYDDVGLYSIELLLTHLSMRCVSKSSIEYKPYVHTCT